MGRVDPVLTDPTFLNLNLVTTQSYICILRLRSTIAYLCTYVCRVGYNTAFLGLDLGLESS
jgi:hypothetical protein